MSGGFGPFGAAPFGALEEGGGIISDISGLPDPLPAKPPRSAAFYAELAQTVCNLLPDFATGSIALIRKSEVQSADPLRNTIDATKRYPVNAYAAGYPERMVDGSRIRAGDVRVLIAAAELPAPPTVRDALEIDPPRGLHAIASVMQVPAAGRPILYIIQGRIE